jgi:hypothetical protein
MQAERTASPLQNFSPRLHPGLYRIADRRYLIRDGAVRRVGANGQPSRYIVARQAGAGLQLTGNGQAHAPAMHALATGRAERLEIHCRHAGCGRVLTDPQSQALGLGSEHREAVA